MTKPWRPQSNVVPLRRRRRWTRAEAYWVPARKRSGVSRSSIVVVLCAAVSAGLAVGLYWPSDPPAVVATPGGDRGAAIEADAESPRAAGGRTDEAEPDAALNRAWAKRANRKGEEIGSPRPFGARDDGVRLAFGLCHTGGGTNCVVDGDTFYLGGAKVRIAGIDAPETHDYARASEKALGDRATAELRALLNSGAVTMTSIDRNRDPYGRLLRNVAVDGADVGEALISTGVARDYGSGRRGWC